MIRDMKHILKVMMLVALMTGATVNVCASEKKTENGYTVIVNKAPNDAAGSVVVSISSGGVVTLTVSPASDYFVKKNTIKAEKMVAAASAPRRADVLGNNLTISGDEEASYGNSKDYSFTIPSGFTGASVTVTFYKKTLTPIFSLEELKTAIESDPSGSYELVSDVSGSGFESIETFTGTLDGGFHKITGLSNPLFKTLNGGKVRNVILEGVNISGLGNIGAIACVATGASRIYNCGILPTNTELDMEGNITGFSGSYVGGTDYVGGLVGQLIGGDSGSPRVINCYSYATITGGNIVAGIVGYIGGTDITQGNLTTVPMVVNCMFYGDITSGSTKYPVYGGNAIKNDATNGVNPYCYFRKNATFDNNYTVIDNYNKSWPAEEKNLTRFEYYRSILNSNKQLCTYWVTDKAYSDQTAADTALIAKWVLDETIAPYPILKKWGKYYSVINRDPKYRINPETKIKESRSLANEWEGKDLGSLKVTINPGGHAAGGASTKTNVPFVITDMDTLNCDFGYYKIQLPYYNEQFGDPTVAIPATTALDFMDKWDQRYGGNYKEYVVTGWEISGGSDANNYNFADRNSYKGRVFAQGGYFYVPKDLENITITAHWGKAVYLANRGRSIDRVNVTNAGYKLDSPFAPAGTMPDIFKPAVTTNNVGTIYGDLQDAIKALQEKSTTYPTVYDQAIVLIGNHQVKNGGDKNATYSIGYNLDNKWHPFTFMSADLDIDNEPDYCLQLQFRSNTDRPGIQPIRFDFLPVVELGLAVRHNKNAYAIGIFIPQGHFEVTETALIRTTQFEYDADVSRIEDKSPVILNGGEFEMFTKRKQRSNTNQRDRTSYFLLGGNAWVHRFAPGAHPNSGDKPDIYLFPVNVIGGEVKELYLTGLYRPELPIVGTSVIGGAPRCYIDGGKFDIVAGTGYDKVKTGEDVIFKINHSKISEFYGGGINGSNPISGNIDVTIDNSRVEKYCGGPKVGNMTGKTVTTHATGTTFGVFFGGGNGGNSYYRQLQDDSDRNTSDAANTTTGEINNWDYRNFRWSVFSPLKTKYDDGTESGQTGLDKKNDNKGFHAEYEFEVFNQSNGVSDQITQRGFIKWIQFGITTTGDVYNELTDCTVKNNFYGGGNLASVSGNVESLLKGNTIIEGSVFGAGYSASIPTFHVQDKSRVVYPKMDFAGTITDGYIPYTPTVYEWTNDNNNGQATKSNPTYSKGGKNYCYTWNSLADLGKVTGNVTLTITGTTEVKGNVFGGGDQGEVGGSTTVNIQE